MLTKDRSGRDLTRLMFMFMFMFTLLASAIT